MESSRNRANDPHDPSHRPESGDTAQFPVVPPPQDPARPPSARGSRRRRAGWHVPALAGVVVVFVLAGVGLAYLSRQGRTEDPVDVGAAAATSTAGPTAPASATPSATPTPSASPSPSPSPKTSKKAGGGTQEGTRTYASWPNESTTGVPAGVSLTKKSGTLKITKAGTVVDRIDLTGCISVAASNVTIKRSRIRGSCAEGTIGPHYNANYKNLLIEDVEIDGLKESTSYSGVGGGNFTCRRCKIHGTGSGIRAGSNSVVEDSYLYGNHVGGESHNTAMSIHGGSNITIRHNYLRCDGGWNCSSSLSLYSPDGPIDHVLVEANLFSGGGYCVYGGVYKRDGGIIAATYVRFLNNGFLTNQWPKCGDLGPVAGWEAPATGNVWSGNYWYPDKKKLVEP
jgi:hypothetical protein